MTHSPSTPANPAQVTDAMVEEFVQTYERETYHRYDRDAIHAALTSAIGAGGQAVAWVRPEVLAKLQDGCAANHVDLSKIKGGNFTEPLYASPTPPSPGVSEAMVEALRDLLRLYESKWSDEPAEVVAARSAIETAPAGGEWQWVPVEPTPEMIAAFWRQKNTGTQEIGMPVADKDYSDYAAYRAMLAASPAKEGRS